MAMQRIISSPALLTRKRKVFRVAIVFISLFSGVVGGTNGAAVSEIIAVKIPPPPARFTFSGWVETGITANADDPKDHQNFGHLFTDRSNEFLLNQIVLTAERTLDPAATGFDWGFKAQALYGSDARYIHSTGFLQNTQHDIVQPDLVEAWVLLHAAITGTAGGLDVKIGKFITLEGVETIDPRTNIFYSHSYIFNYALPINHTGVISTLHLAKWIDLYGGATRGVNTGTTDNNGSAAFHGGVGFNFADGKLSALATTHIGPENPNNDHDLRYLNDLVVTWKPTEKLTAVIDFAFAEDESVSGGAKAYGAAGYLSYAANNWLTLGARAEIYRDEKGFFVGSFAGNDNFIDIQRGKTNALDSRTFFQPGTFTEITVGATIKLPTPKPFLGISIRPEIRYDAALTSGRPFSDRRQPEQLTFGLDAVLKF
ncbi:MAG: porin [Chthoniobacterales bacterium]|nr:MAG: porin [Chthoniobacterales bacterium]